MLKSTGTMIAEGLVIAGGVGRGPLGCLDCRSSQVSLLFGATPDENLACFPQESLLVFLYYNITHKKQLKK